MRWFMFVGVVLRLLLMPFTMQSDVRFVGDLVAMHVDAREFVTADPRADLPLYPPLAYWTLYAWQQVVGLVVPDVHSLQKDTPRSWQDWYTHPSRFAMLFLLKLWVLPFDLLAGLLLLRLVAADKRRLIAAAWFLNPVLIYTTAIHGQFDALPVCLCVLGLLALRRQQFVACGFALGVAAAFKLYALLFLPPLLLLLPSVARLRTLAAFVVPFGLPFVGVLPRYLAGHPYYDASFALLRVGDVALPVYALLYVAASVALLRLRTPTIGRQEWRAYSAFLLLLLLFYLQAPFDLHYWAWALPFVLLLWADDGRVWRPVALLLLCALILYLRVWPAFLLPLDMATFGRASGVLWPDGVVVLAQAGIFAGYLWLLWLSVRARPYPANPQA
jgi:hypothetical protein